MELIKAILLGCIQGATEFLPVSSSGHLVLGSHLLGFQEQGIIFEVMLHLGTLLSVVIVFRKELFAMVLAPFKVISGRQSADDYHYLSWDFYVILGTLPAVVIGLGFKDRIETAFTSVSLVCFMLIFTGLIMIVSRYLPDRAMKINSWRAVVIGCAQALAILPGLSRSGSTIFAGMLLGINRETVARFSFIMSVPAILGAAVLNLKDVVENPPGQETILYLVAGTSAAAVTGYFAIILLLDVIKKNRLPWFGYYCLAVAITGLSVIALNN